ncbi:MAG: helix-turn-helix domain-containing protein [Jatrophihabitans sp.]
MRQYREARGLSLRDLAQLSGIGRSRLQQLESAEAPNPTLSVLLALQHAFGLASIEALLGDLPSQGAHAAYIRASEEMDEPPPLTTTL